MIKENFGYKVIKSTKTALNNDIELFSASDSKHGNFALIIGVFHGDEPQGKFLIEEYIKNNKKSNSLYEKLFIPCLNPDGMRLNTRTNSNGVDINRNFPTKNWVLGQKDLYFGGDTPASESETKFITEIMDEYKPKIILTLHTPYKIVNYDGPAEEIAKKISDIIGYPTESSIGYPTPGSFGTYAGAEKQIPVITLELDEECPVEDLKEPVHRIFDEVL